jgi:hypothetical protein
MEAGGGRGESIGIDRDRGERVSALLTIFRRSLKHRYMSEIKEHDCPTEDTYIHTFLLEGPLPPDYYANMNRVFTEAQMRCLERIPKTFKLKPGEWIQGPGMKTEKFASGATRTTLKVEYLRADQYSRILYKEAVLPGQDAAAE